MAHKQRTPLQVSDEFLNKLKDLQRKVRMTTGDEKSLRELTDHIAKSNVFNDVERMIANKGDVNMDIKVRFDRRLFK